MQRCNRWTPCSLQPYMQLCRCHYLTIVAGAMLLLWYRPLMVLHCCGCYIGVVCKG